MASNTQSPGSGRGFTFSDRPGERLYVRPKALVPSSEAPRNTPFPRLAGGPLAFQAVEIISRGTEGTNRAIVPSQRLRDWIGDRQPDAAGIETWLTRLEQPARICAGLRLDRPRLMGIVNVTPDSFSDGGEFVRTEDAVAHGRALIEAGADMLDIGGESTRPGAPATDPDIQIERVLPVIAGLRDTGAPISIDTRSARVMGAAVDAGARIINDVSALNHDAAAMETARRLAVPVILTHHRGTPVTMRTHARYQDVTLDVFDELEARCRECLAAGLSPDNLLVDPGFGFAKTRAQNAELLSHLAMLHGLGYPLVVGASRKLFAPGHGRMRGTERLAAALAAALAGAARGAHILRVHDVAETRAALEVWWGTITNSEDG